MGRHSAPARASRQLKRTATNSAAVLLVTVFVTATVYAGIALFASAKDAEIPPPTAAAFAVQADPGAQQHVSVPGPGTPSEPMPEGAMRRCPATGCAAPTCHAETGEPIPGY